jgi:hypothetical protein
MLYNEYDIGDLVRLDILIQVSGVNINPNYLSLSVTDPDGWEDQFVYGTTGSFVQDTVGRYHLDYFVRKSGQYKYRFFSSGTAWGAEARRFVVRRE